MTVIGIDLGYSKYFLRLLGRFAYIFIKAEEAFGTKTEFENHGKGLRNSH